MKSWVFVYNQPRLYPTNGTLVQELRKENPEITIRVWQQDDLMDFVLKLGASDLGKLLPGWQRGIDIGDPIMKAMTEMVGANTVATPVPLINKLPTNHSSLNTTLDRISEVDREIRARLLGYSVWLDPLETQRACDLLSKKGYVAERIELNLRTLNQEGLLKLTANHILPMNTQVCDEAADEVAEEFLALLEEL